MYSNLIRRNWLIACASVIIILMTAIAFTPSFAPVGQAADDMYGTPEPAATPDTSQVNNSHESVNIQIPKYIRTIEGLAGTILYQPKRQFINHPSGPDPANGQLITGDTWLEVDDTGSPTRYHAQYLFSDGVIHMEIFQTSEQRLIYLGPRYGTKHGCERWPSSKQAMNALLPAFVNETGLSAAGFTPIGQVDPSVSFSKTRLLDITNPTETYGYDADGKVTLWKKKATVSLRDGRAASQITTLEIGADGYIMLDATQVIDSEGKLYIEESRASGPLQVFNAKSVTSSIWDLPFITEEACK